MEPANYDQPKFNQKQHYYLSTNDQTIQFYQHTQPLVVYYETSVCIKRLMITKSLTDVSEINARKKLPSLIIAAED